MLLVLPASVLGPVRSGQDGKAKRVLFEGKFGVTVCDAGVFAGIVPVLLELAGWRAPTSRAQCRQKYRVIMTSSLPVDRVHSDSARSVRLAAITPVAMGVTTVACTNYCHPDESTGSGTAFKWLRQILKGA